MYNLPACPVFYWRMWSDKCKPVNLHYHKRVEEMEVGAVVRHHFACHTGSSRLGSGLFNSPTVWSLVMVLLLPVVLMVNSEANPISLGWLITKFGIFQPVALVCSTIGMLAILSALSYIWTWKMDDDPNGLRSTIALDSRTPLACHPERSSPYLPCRANRYLLPDFMEDNHHYIAEPNYG
jgi:hypothetical protein